MDKFGVIEKNRALIEGMVRKTLKGISAYDHEDIASDIMLALYDRLDNYNPDKGMSISSYICMVTSNLCIDWSRKQSVRFAQSLETGGAEGEGIDLPCEDDTVEDLMISNEQRAKLRACLDTLGEDWKAFAFELMADNANPKDIASKLGIAVNLVYMRKYRLISLLKEMLKD